MTQARLKIKVKGLRVEALYDVETINVTVVAGVERTAAHLRKYSNKDKDEYNIVVVPIDWVEIVQEHVAS